MKEVELPAFKGAYIWLRRLEDDAELHNSPTETVTFRLPRQLLNLSAMTCLFNCPGNALQLWNEHRRSMIENLFIDNDETATENFAPIKYKFQR